jgi:hypothetical protein
MTTKNTKLTELEPLAGADFVARLKVAASRPDFSDEVKSAFGAGPQVMGGLESRYPENIPDLVKLTSVPDWDGHNGQVIPLEIWDQVSRIARQAFDLAGIPFVSPCGDGTVHLEWTSKENQSFTLEVSKLESLIWTIRTRNQESRHVSTRFGLTKSPIPLVVARLKAGLAPL